MKRTVTAAIVACFAGIALSAPAMADSVVVKVVPTHHYHHYTRSVSRVVVHPYSTVRTKVVSNASCRTKTVKVTNHHHTVVRSTRVCR